MRIVIFTRFSLYFPQSNAWRLTRDLKHSDDAYRNTLFSEQRLQAKLRQFKTLTARSVGAFSPAHDIWWIIAISSQLPQNYKHELQTLTYTLKPIRLQIKEVDTKEKFETLRKQVLNHMHAKKHVFATVRLDDDDALAPHYPDVLSKYSNLAPGTIVSFPNGRLYKESRCGNIVVSKPVEKKNAPLGLARINDDVYCGNSRILSNLGYSVVYDNTPDMFLLCCGDTTDNRRKFKNVDTGDLRNMWWSMMMHSSPTSISKMTEVLYKYLNNEQETLIYYSKTKYNILFQRPQQIMRHFNKNYNKVFIGLIDEPVYEEKYNLLIVPYGLRGCVYNCINNARCITYYTDTRLFHEVENRKGVKLFDLIDAPMDEFSVWKPNLKKAVRNADYVMYSHPKLIEHLKQIDNEKTYHYISNACDYEHFSKAKERIGTRPNDFPQTDKPILGYYGSFAKWLDFDLIRKFADGGKYHIVMIGGLRDNPRYNIRFKHSNITWLDHKHYDELPYYLSWFDVCFLPFKDCQSNKYVNPCKLWEYLACEKEIVKSGIDIEYDKIQQYPEICTEINNIIGNSRSPSMFRHKVGIVTNMYLHWSNLKPSIGGGERYCNELIKILKTFNFDIEIHQLGNENLVVNHNGVKINIYKNTFEYNGELAIGFSRFINEQIKYKYDFVIYMMPELCCSENIVENSILINHGIWFDRREKPDDYYELLKLQIIKCKKIICVDTNYINFVRSIWGYNFQKNKLSYIPNFVDDHYVINKINKNFDKKLTVLFPRRANLYRGSRIIPYLLKNIQNDVNFIWCGDGEDGSKLKKLEIVDTRFSYVTSDFDKIINYYKKSNIVVIPTIASEGTSLSCIEAMATYNVVLSTNVGGLPNLIIDNFNGYLCDNTKESLCSKLKYIINNYNNIHEKICNNAQSVVKESFLKTRWNKQVIDIIKEFDMRNKKIAIVTKNCINGGVESIINIHKQMLECDVFVCNGKIDHKNKPFEFSQNLKNYNEVIECLSKYDIIISHWVPKFVQNAYNEIAKKNTIIEFVHRTDTNDNKKHFLDGVITHSNFLKEHIKKYSNFDETKIYTLHHPINTHLFKPNTKTSTKIGIIGSYNQFKGVDIFIKAINLIKDNELLNDYELCVYGKDDGFKQQYIELAKSLNLTINFYDATNKVNEIINEFEILCIPSTLEGFPVILCEALSCNTKIIASDIVGVKECHEFAAKNGYDKLFCLFESENYKELSKNIIKLLKNEIVLKNEKGNEFIEKYFSVESHMINLNNIISHLHEHKNKDIEINVTNYKNITCNIDDLKKQFDILLVDRRSIPHKVRQFYKNFKNIKFNKNSIIRLHMLSNTLRKFKLVIEFDNINDNSNLTVNNQLDLLDENDKLYYDVEENFICLTNKHINIEVNIPDKHKLIYINIVPIDKTYINIKKILFHY